MQAVGVLAQIGQEKEAIAGPAENDSLLQSDWRMRIGYHSCADWSGQR